MENTDIDLIIIGGGINGAGIARDAAGRGLTVLLCEKDDLAQHTSSASTKLIHGGLRYLEFYDFKLVRHSLKEREVLLRAAPHIIWPLRFILPHHKALRPRWLIRAGLFLYDYIGGRKLLPVSHSINLKTHVAGRPLKPEFTNGFEYSDCWVQDSRLVVLNAMDAVSNGAQILTHTKCTGLSRHDDHWQVQMLDQRSGKETSKTAKVVINASGPWVERTLNLNAENGAQHGVRLVKGSHIIVPKIFDHAYPYIFQNSDNRIIFAIPYEKDFTLLGTTDVEVTEDPESSHIEAAEIDYICNAVNEYFSNPVKAADIIWTYSGVRPLYDDAASNASKVTRDYKLDFDTDNGAPILSVYGGKITTFRKLSEEVVDMIQEQLGNSSPAWTESAPLPGGDMPDADFEQFLQHCTKLYPWLESDLLLNYARNYGTRIHLLISGAGSMSALGQHFTGPLYQAEVDYLVKYEWVVAADDILWRRTKYGLHVLKGTRDTLQAYLEKQHGLKAIVDPQSSSNSVS